MGQDTFYELARRSIPISKNDGLSLSYQDSIVNARTDKGMTFLEFSYNLQCLEKKIDLIEYSIPNPKNSPAINLFKNVIKSEMKNYDYTEMIVDSSFWPHNNNLTQEMANIIMSAWSPTRFYENKSVLAILNNVGGVEIFMKHLSQWTSILNLSPYVQKCLNYNETPQNFEELKISVYTLETSAICWAPELNTNYSCYFVTAQKNSAVLFWQLHSQSEPFIKIKIQTNMSEIIYMLWIAKNENQFWLICSDNLGQVNALDMHFQNDNIVLKDTHELWKCKDRMIASHLNYGIFNENVILMFSKQRHLVLQLLNPNCKILSQYIHNINDYRIISITKALDGYYLGTQNVEIYKFKLNINDTSISVDLIQFPFKDTYATYELNSIGFSNTNTLAVLGMVDRRLHCRKETYKFDIVFLTTEYKLGSLIPTLLSNPSKKLTKYYDCIEAFRYKIMKTKLIPVKECNLLYSEGFNDSYKLKIYLFLLIILLNIRKAARISSDIYFPEMSVETVKERLLMLHAQSTLDSLYKKHEEKGKLTGLEEEILHGCIKYLQFYSKKHKTELIMHNKKYNIMKTHFKYICQSCDEEINDDFTCINGHLNMYCILSFTPINSDDYLVCKSCGSTSRTDLCVNEPLCVFCDQYLIKVD